MFYILFRLFDESVVAREPVGVGVVCARHEVHSVVIARAGEHRERRRVVRLREQALGFAGDAGVRDETVAVAAVYAPFVRRERVIELRDHADLCRAHVPVEIAPAVVERPENLIHRVVRKLVYGSLDVALLARARAVDEVEERVVLRLFVVPVMRQTHGEHGAKLRVVNIAHEQRYHEEIVVVINVEQVAVKDFVLHEVHGEVLVPDEIFKRIFVSLIAGDMISRLEEGQNLKRVRSLFIYPLVVVVEQIGVPVCPCGRHAVGVNESEFVVENMVENLLDNGGYQLLLLIVRDEIKVVRVCVEMTDHLVGRGLAEPLELVAVLVGGVVPFVAHARAVAGFVDVSYRAGGEALYTRYLGELYHREQRAVSRGANFRVLGAGVFKAQRAEIKPRPESVVVAGADIAFIFGHNALMLKRALEHEAVLADIVFLAECAKSLCLLFERHHLSLENADAAGGGGDAEAAVGREDDAGRVHVGQPALVAVI